MLRPRLFLSAVSTELRSARQALARVVRTLGYDPVSQDDFPTGHGELRKWLREQIDGCEGLIQLVGDGYGAEPAVADPDFGRVSYTQFELLHAMRQGKKTWVIVIGEHFVRDTPREQLDLPDAASTLEPAAAHAYQAERRALQRAYRARIERENHLRHTANNEIELQNLILRLPDELGKLRQAEEGRQRRVRNALVAILIGVTALGGGGWFAYQRLFSRVEQAAVVNTEKIRAHLRTTAEETHAREQAQADAVIDWQDRQRAREAADAAHAARLLRIEDLASSFAEIEGRGNATGVLQEMSRILADQGVDEAIAYVGSQRSSILQGVRARATATRERNQNELRPLLRTAALYEAKGQRVDARALYADILDIAPDWPEALDATFWFLVEQGDQSRIYASVSAAQRDYDEAHRLAQRLIEVDPANSEWQRDLSVSHNKIGDILLAQGDGPGALAAYRKTEAIAEALVVRDPANTAWRRDLSVSHNKIGNVLLAQGDGPGALAAYRKSLAIREALAVRDPANSAWQHDLAVSHERIGDVLRAYGDGPGALAAYRKTEAIAEALAARDPANALWQRDLSVSHNKIGDLLFDQGNGQGALAAYHKGLVIREALAVRDPANSAWQRDLAVSRERIGDVLVAQDDSAGALEAYRKSLVIREALAVHDPTNTERQRDLSVSHERISNVLFMQGDETGALLGYRKNLVIAEALAVRDPDNSEWQRGLSVSLEKIGNVLVAQGDVPGALAAFRKSLAIREALVGRDPANAEWQRDLAVNQNKIGDVLVTQGDGPGAFAAYDRSLKIAEALAARDPANTEWQRDLIVSYVKLSEVSGDKTYVQRALEIAEDMQQRGVLAPRDAWLIDELKRRAAG